MIIFNIKTSFFFITILHEPNTNNESLSHSILNIFALSNKKLHPGSIKKSAPGLMV